MTFTSLGFVELMVCIIFGSSTSQFRSIVSGWHFVDWFVGWFRSMGSQSQVLSTVYSTLSLDENHRHKLGRIVNVTKLTQVSNFSLYDSTQVSLCEIECQKYQFLRKTIDSSVLNSSSVTQISRSPISSQYLQRVYVRNIMNMMCVKKSYPLLV